MKILFLLFLSLTIIACDQHSAQKVRNKKPIQVHVVKTERTPLSATRLVTGSLEAIISVKIFNQEEGRIIALPFRQGDIVNKGDLLVEIDASLIQALLNKALANLKQAKTDVRRLKSLFRKKLSSEDELARAETAESLAKSEVNLLKTRLSHTKIRAPFSGVISVRNNEPGDVVPLHSHILELIDEQQLKIQVHLSELLLANIKVGNPVHVRIDALGEQKYLAKVSRIYPTIDPRTRQGIMEVILDVMPEGARPGQLSRIIITSKTTPRLNIPYDAIRNDSKGQFVFRVDKNNTIEMIRVKTGIQLDKKIEIIDGLNLHDQVVTKGFIGLKKGSQVNIRPLTINSSSTVITE